MEKFYYTIAGLTLQSDIDLVAIGLRGFKPFVTEACDANCALHIDNELNIANLSEYSQISSSYIAEADADSKLYKSATGYIYAVWCKGTPQPILFEIDTQTNDITTNVVITDTISLSLLRFGIWIMFGIVSIPLGCIAIHSSAIICRNRAILFLGESGTGKSTHTRLWRENIEGARLLNDDSPILRIVGDEVLVYGSPWSGKTPCYKNEVYPIAGFCRLSQAPHNAIRRLPTIAALGALLPSCPPQFADDDELKEAIYTSLGKILKSCATYHLECLPNSDAAQLSHDTILGNE
jgi:hypothetical protein